MRYVRNVDLRLPTFSLLNQDKMIVRRVKQCELILLSLPAKMCQSRSLTVKLHEVNE